MQRRVGILAVLTVLVVVGTLVFTRYRPISAKEQALTAVLNRFHDEGKFDGVALVVDRGEILVKQAYGLANKERNTANTTTTKFRIASLTKLFVATQILQLHEQGKLRVTDTVAVLVPDLAAPWAKQVTVHHLLTNTSGLQLYEARTPQPIDAYTTRRSLDDFLQAYCLGPLDVAPGTQFRYNNADYVVLTKIIETVTGHSWAEALEAQILDPLELRNTGVVTERTDLQELAAGYYTENGTIYTPDPAYYAENYFGGGAMYSTIDDLFRFERALHGNQLVSDQTKALMRRPNPQFGGAAYGTFVLNQPVVGRSIRTSERWGSTWGSSSTFVQFLDDDRAIILLANTNNIKQSATYQLKTELTNVLYTDPEVAAGGARSP